MPDLVELLDRDLQEVVRDIDQDLRTIDADIEAAGEKVDRDLEDLVSEFSNRPQITFEKIKETYRASLVEQRLKSLQTAKEQLHELKKEILGQISSPAIERRKQRMFSVM